MKNYQIIIFTILFAQTSYAQALKICLTGTTEKALPAYGEAFQNGVKLAIKEYENKESKVPELIVSYHEATPLAPLEKIKELKAIGCHAVIGFSTGNDLVAISGFLKTNPLLTISLYGDPSKKVDQIPHLLTMQPSAKVMVEHLFNKLDKKIDGKKNFIIVTAIDRSEMIEYEEAFSKEILKRGARFQKISVVEQTQKIDAFLEIKDKITSDDIVVLLTRSKLAAMLVDALPSEIASKTLILGTKYFGTNELPAFLDFLKNKNIEAYVARQNCGCDESPEFISFKDRYIQSFNKSPMLISMEAFEATKFILLAAEIKNPTPAKVITYLKGKSSDYKVGSSAFQKNMKVVSTKKFIIKVSKDGYEGVK